MPESPSRLDDASLSGLTPDLNASDDQSTGMHRQTSDVRYSFDILAIQKAAVFPSEIQSTFPRCLEIIEQPDCSAKVRYRTDYTPPSKRRDPLITKNPDSNYTGPTVCVSEFRYFHFSTKIFLFRF